MLQKNTADSAFSAYLFFFSLRTPRYIFFSFQIFLSVTVPHLNGKASFSLFNCTGFIWDGNPAGYRNREEALQRQ